MASAMSVVGNEAAATGSSETCPVPVACNQDAFRDGEGGLWPQRAYSSAEKQEMHRAGIASLLP